MKYLYLDVLLVPETSNLTYSKLNLTSSFKRVPPQSPVCWLHNFPRFKTLESSLIPSLPDSSTFDCKVLLILPPQYLYHPHPPFLSLPTVPLVWTLISFKRFLEVSWLQSIPASSLSQLQSKIPQLHTYKAWLLSCHLIQKASTTLHCLWNNDWHLRSDTLQPVLCSSQPGLLNHSPNMSSIIFQHLTVVCATPSAWNALSFRLTSA